MNDIDPNNPPAFPFKHRHIEPFERGMTLRDYFAAKAMQGLWSIGKTRVVDSAQIAYTVQIAYIMADAMLKERAK